MNYNRYNREKLQWLFDNDLIRLNYDSLFDENPEPLPPGFTFDRVAGMLLGLAIGDSLSNTTEKMHPERRRKMWGEITDYLPNRHFGDEPKGSPTSETQLPFWSLGQMLRDGGFHLHHQVRKMAAHRTYTTQGRHRGFAKRYEAGKEWHQCANDPKSQLTGALPRIPVVILPHLKSPTAGLWVDAALAARIGYQCSGVIASCVAFVGMLWELLRASDPPEPGWWVETFVETAHYLEDGVCKAKRGEYRDYAGMVWEFVAEKVPSAYSADLPVEEACALWFPGDHLLEAIPSALYIMMRHAHQGFEAAMLRAVNDTYDNGRIAAIVGAFAGALYGQNEIPRRWIENLPGVVYREQDGNVHALILQAEKMFWKNPVR